MLTTRNAVLETFYLTGNAKRHILKIEAHERELFDFNRRNMANWYVLHVFRFFTIDDYPYEDEEVLVRVLYLSVDEALEKVRGYKEQVTWHFTYDMDNNPMVWAKEDNYGFNIMVF